MKTAGSLQPSPPEKSAPKAERVHKLIFNPEGEALAATGIVNLAVATDVLTKHKPSADSRLWN